MKYKLHHREQVAQNLVRLAVRGGWLYMYTKPTIDGGSALQFVPDYSVEIEE